MVDVFDIGAFSAGEGVFGTIDFLVESCFSGLASVEDELALIVADGSITPSTDFFGFSSPSEVDSVLI